MLSAWSLRQILMIRGTTLRPTIKNQVGKLRAE